MILDEEGGGRNFSYLMGLVAPIFLLNRNGWAEEEMSSMYVSQSQLKRPVAERMLLVMAFIAVH
jgi:hypothetical protein